MNLYENLATQAITSFFYKEAIWKKEILFDFLLKPFNLQLGDIAEVKTQDNLKGTIPDFSIITREGKKIYFEVKINNSALTQSELEENTRDAYLIRKEYYYFPNIPVAKERILYWEDLFELIDQKGATEEFNRFQMLREYMNEDIHTILLTPHEVAMLYSRETILAVYGMKEKVITLCKNFLEANTNRFQIGIKLDNEWGIGYFFRKIEESENMNLFIGLSPHVNEDQNKYFSIAKRRENTSEEWVYYPLDKEILAKCDSDEDLQEAFNKDAEKVIEEYKL